MMLLETLKTKATDKEFLELEDEIDAEKAFLLVRDMPTPGQVPVTRKPSLKNGTAPVLVSIICSRNFLQSLDTHPV